jgi:hypothetical protein
MSWKNNLRNGISIAPKLFHDKERKSMLKILTDIFSLVIDQRTLPVHYFSRHLYKLGANNIHNYIPNKTLLSLYKKINNQSSAQVLINKLFFYLFYSQFFTNLAKVLMYNNKDVFIINGRRFKIETIEAFEAVLYDLAENWSPTKSIFIKKTYDSHGGANACRISLNDFPLNTSFIKNLFSEVKDSAYLFQETVSQHAEMNRLNPSCINTIRMDTFIDRDSNAEIISPYLRMSINNLCVDNTSSGGCFVGIDPDGRLKKYGFTSITKSGGEILTAHPQTKVVFQDFKIPHYTEAKEFIIEVAKIVPDLRLIGWDIAITESGPLLIEGNYNYDISNHDLTYGGYKSHPVFRKVLEELDQI